MRLLGKQVYTGTFTARLVEQFSPLVKKTIHNYINDIITERLNNAMKDNDSDNNNKSEESITEEEPEQNNSIITTEEELQAFYIIKAILREDISTEIITYKDVQSYFSVLIDNNRNKCICRLYFNNPSNKRIAFLDKSDSTNNDTGVKRTKELSYPINNIDEIYNYTSEIKKALEKLL